MPVDKFGRMSDTKTRDTGVSLTYINNNYIRSDGGTPVTGSIDMRGHTLYNVAEPVKSQDVATKDYADYIKASTQDYVNYIVKEIREKLDKRPQLITVTSSFTDVLRPNVYQFSFGGNDDQGFLIPHSGRIKKIVTRWHLKEDFYTMLLTDPKLFSPVFFFFFQIEKYYVEYDKGGEVSNTETYTCFPENPYSKNLSEFFVDEAISGFCVNYDQFMENKYEEVKRGDVINVRTTFEETPIPEEKRIDTHNTYYITFLIELDPL